MNDRRLVLTLAIVLAAARTRVLSPEAIRARVDAPLSLLRATNTGAAVSTRTAGPAAAPVSV